MVPVRDSGVCTARAAETIQDMHYCDATKLEKTEAGGQTRLRPRLASMFNVHRRSQGGEEETWGSVGGVWYTTTRMNYNNHNHDSYGSMHV